MTSSRIRVAAAVVAALLLLAGVRASAGAEGGGSPVTVSLLGGVHVLNQNDTALPDHFINIPLAGAVGYDFTPNWGVEGEFSWLIPVKTSVDVGTGGSQDLKSPDVLSYQANVIGRLPVAGTPWAPYLTAGLGAVTFLSTTDADRYPQLTESQTAFAINFGAGTTYGFGSRWAVRADFRELVAFPSDGTQGLSSPSGADPIWMERVTVGAGYRF